MVLSSTESTHANREGSVDFTLDLKDVCWDLPLTAPALSAGNTDDGADTDLVYDCYQNTDNTFVITAMNTQWNDYCEGFSYTIVYVDGDFEDDNIPT